MISLLEVQNYILHLPSVSCLYFHYVIFHSPYLRYLEDYHLLLQRRIHRIFRLFHTTPCSIYVGKVSGVECNVHMNVIHPKKTAILSCGYRMRRFGCFESVILPISVFQINNARTLTHFKHQQSKNIQWNNHLRMPCKNYHCNSHSKSQHHMPLRTYLSEKMHRWLYCSDLKFDSICSQDWWA